MRNLLVGHVYDVFVRHDAPDVLIRIRIRDTSCEACRTASLSPRHALPVDWRRRRLHARSRTGIPSKKGRTMTVARITEISSVSTVSFQDAIVQGIDRANQTLKNLKGAWVKDQEVTIDNGKVTGYKVILKVTFILTE
jgi:flavin-binding protein dodecin